MLKMKMNGEYIEQTQTKFQQPNLSIWNVIHVIYHIDQSSSSSTLIPINLYQLYHLTFSISSNTKQSCQLNKVQYHHFQLFKIQVFLYFPPHLEASVASNIQFFSLLDLWPRSAHDQTILDGSLSLSSLDATSNLSHVLSFLFNH